MSNKIKSMSIDEFSKLTIEQVSKNCGVSASQLAESITNILVANEGSASRLFMEEISPNLDHLLLDEIESFPFPASNAGKESS